MKTTRTILWTLVFLAAVGTGLALHQMPNLPPQSTAQSVTQSAIEPAFTLVDHNGQTVSEKDYRGKWLLVFFGFTHCPDICPTTLAEIAQIMNRLETDADKVQPLFITVDPERDTPEIMAEYVSIFHSSIIGLTGTKEQVKQAADNFRVYYSRVEEKDAPDDYFMDHSAFIYLIDPQGRFIEPFSYGEAVTDIVTGIRKYMEEKS